MRLRGIPKTRGPNEVCIFCALKYGYEFLSSQPLATSNFKRPFHTSQKLPRPSSAAAVTREDDEENHEVPTLPTPRKLRKNPKGGFLDEGLNQSLLGRFATGDSNRRIHQNARNANGSRSMNRSERLSSNQPRTKERAADSASSPLLHRPLPFKHQEIPSSFFSEQHEPESPRDTPHSSVGLSNDESSWGSLGSDDSSSDHTIATIDNRDGMLDLDRSSPSKGRPQEVQEEQTKASTFGQEAVQSSDRQEHAFPSLRRHYAPERKIKRVESSHYPNGTNHSSRLNSYQSSPPTGMAALEKWAKDPRSASTEDFDTLRDFEKSKPRIPEAPAYKGRMSVLDNWDKDAWGKNALPDPDPDPSSFNYQADGGVQQAPMSRSNPSSHVEWNSGSSQLPNTGYNVATDFAPYSQKPGTHAAEIAVQHDFKCNRRAGSNVRRNRINTDFVDEVAVRRIDEPGRARRPRRSSYKIDDDAGDDDVADDFEGFEDELGSGRSKRKKKEAARKAPTSQLVKQPAPIHLPKFITVERLALAMRVELGVFLHRLRRLGYEEPAYDHILDYENSSLICQEFNFEPVATEETLDLAARPPPDQEILATLPHRPPIVTIMGHVDHGKTTILDWLRKSTVAASEHGGITQHIGAFSVKMPGSEKIITFLDTPGHAAFLEMRRRGATVTDVVVLVVAADDSVKPQTLEAIKHAQESKVAIIVAINKVDKEDANVERVKQDLARHGIDVESYGGDTQAISVSGKTGEGMVDLEEAIIAEAENLPTQVEFDGPAEGWIIEASMGSGGRLATVLVRRGTLRPRDIVVAGKTWSRVRCLRNDAGVLVDSAAPGTPVVVDGWRDQPEAGAEVIQAESEDQAKKVVDLRTEMEEYAQMAEDASAINAHRREEAEARAQQKAWESEQDWFKKSPSRHPKDNVGWVENTSNQQGGPRRIDVLVKADVAGSVEAVVNAVSSIGNNEIATNIVDSGVGPVNESDIEYLAATGSTGYIVSFNQQDDGLMTRRAEAAGVPILSHTIIYNVTDDLTEKLSNELPPSIIYKTQGEAEIGQVFTIDAGKRGATKIAGCKVTNGSISRDRKVRVLRNKEIIFTGTLASLKHLKKDVTESRNGTECGMGFEGWDEFQVGDQIQSIDEKREKRRL